MEQAIDNAGFIAGVAVQHLADGKEWAPTLISFDENRVASVMAIAGEDGGSVEEGRAMLAGGADGAANAALIFDGYLGIDDVRTDALIVEVRSYGAEAGSIQMALPYRPAGDAGDFTVLPLKILAYDGPGITREMIVTAFFRGVERDPEE